METFIILIFLQAIVFGGFSAWLAKQKNRDPLGWFLLGMLFSLIALIAVAAAPPVKPKRNFLDEDTARLRRDNLC